MPSRIAVGQFLLVLNALVQVSQILLVIGKTMQSLDRRVRGGGHGAWLAWGLTGVRLNARLAGSCLTRSWRVVPLFGLSRCDLFFQRCVLLD
jgi:hypothetical protein